PSVDDTAIVPGARALGEAAILQTIEQARNVGIARDHALTDLAARQALRPGPAQDAQCVVLRAGESEVLKLGLNLRLERVGCSQQRKIGFLFPAGEWHSLFDFRLQATRHGARLVVMTSICQTSP